MVIQRDLLRRHRGPVRRPLSNMKNPPVFSAMNGSIHKHLRYDFSHPTWK